MKLLSLSTAWVLGVCLGSLIFWPLPFLLASSGLVLLMAILWRRKAIVLWGGLCLGVLLGGLAWYQWAVDTPSLRDAVGQTVVVEGNVVQDTEYGDHGAWFGLSVKRLYVGDCGEKVSGKVLVYTDPFPSYNQGDELQIRGKIDPLSEIRNPGYRDFLRRRGFVGMIRDPMEIRLEGRSWLFSFRSRLAESLSSALAEPAASLAQGLLLGIRSHMPDGLRGDFFRTGTSHLLAISGFNLAIIGGVVLNIAAWMFGRRHQTYLVVTFAVIWFYSALTGMQPPVLRSAIMFSLCLVALGLGRPSSALPAMALAAAIMVGISPRVLWDVSFQLSFAAVSGLVLVQPHVQGWGERAIPEGHWVSPIVKPVLYSFSVGLAAIVATLPLMVYYFQSFSLVGLPATMIASAFVGGAVVMAGITALLGLFAPFLAWVVGWAAWLFLMCIVGTVEWFGRFPFASVETGPIHPALVWLCYFAMLGVVCRERMASWLARLMAFGHRCVHRLSEIAYRLPKRLTVGVLVLCACLVWAGVLSIPDTKLRVYFLDVGQGDAILIRTPAGQQILIDGGPDPDAICHELGKKLPFWDKSLDLVVLTHCHHDHLNGLMGVLKNYKVGQVLESGFGDTPAYREWLIQLEKRKIKWTIARSGQKISLGQGIYLEVIHPDEGFFERTVPDPNSASVVLRLVWNRVSFLLTGDISKEAEDDIMYGGVVRGLGVTVLKMAHHGGEGSTSQQFVSVVSPQVVVICVGGDNAFGHPSQERLAQMKMSGIDVYRTDQHGTITFSTDGERLWVKTARTPDKL